VSYVDDLITAGDRLFSKRGTLMSFWDCVAQNFAPDLADFNGQQCFGQDYASDLMTSYPLLVARDLADQFGAMLRPSAQVAAIMEVEGLKDHEGKKWLEWAAKVQRRAMYDRAAQYTVAAKTGERFFSLFGQGVLTVESMPDKSSLLYRPWHLRDVVWTNGLSGAVECVHRKWDNPTAWDLKRTFGIEKLHPNVAKWLQPGKDPYCEIKCRHIVVPTDMYEGPEKYRTPLVSIYMDVENKHIMEVTGARRSPYVIPRWQRDHRSQYASSPAVTCALPEARMLQSMAFTLIEAGEKFVRPPLLGVAGAIIRDDINVQAGGITWLEADYDERTGAALAPLRQDKSGMPIGFQMQDRSELMLRKAFYADKLQLPQRGGPQETAYEVGQRVQQYIRDALPLVEPVEIEFNGGLYERTFEVLLEEGAFGPPDAIPRSLRGANIEFKFSSPLREQVDRQKGRIFLEGVQLIQSGAALDPAVANIPDAVTTMRDVLEGIGWEASWVRSPEEVQAAADAQAEQAKAQQMLDSMGQASTIAKNLAGAQNVAPVQ
jgi:hypothetical protein